jgi:hypothetical protein
MRTIKTYSKRAPFYNALIGKVKIHMDGNRVSQAVGPSTLGRFGTVFVAATTLPLYN